MRSLKRNALLRRLSLYCLMVLLWALASLPATGRADDVKTTPTLNEGKKWRIAYYEGGPWANYHKTMMAVVKGLMEKGWIEKKPIPDFPDPDDNRPVWRWLNHSVNSAFLDFIADGYWSSYWNSEMRRGNREACIDRLKRGDVDLIIAMGTWGGKDLANNRHSVPTFVMSTTDPVASGIVRSPEDSGFDHVIARCEPNRYIRQINLCYDIFRFNAIGVIYDARDPEGRVLGHVDKLETVGADRGFRVVACHSPGVDYKDGPVFDKQSAVQAYRKCVRTLAPDIDVLYMGDHWGTNPEYLYETLKPLYDMGIPTWSGRETVLVKAGALMSISRPSFDYLIPFFSESIGKILNGARPRDLNQIFKGPLELAVNLEAARLTGYTVPPNVLKIANTVYHRIETPSDEAEN